MTIPTRTELIVDAGNIVRESAVWDDRTSTLYWVDIIGKKIFAWQQGKTAQRWAMTEIIASIGLCDDSRMILGLAKHVALWDFHAAPVPHAAIEHDQPKTRLNEGAVGPDGCFWVGTMQNNIAADGFPDGNHGGHGAALPRPPGWPGRHPVKGSARHHQHAGLDG